MNSYEFTQTMYKTGIDKGIVVALDIIFNYIKDLEVKIEKLPINKRGISIRDRYVEQKLLLEVIYDALEIQRENI